MANAVDLLRNEQPPVVPPSAFKWVRPENYHVTAKFLGEVPADRLAEVSGACERAAQPLQASFVAVSELALHPPHGSTRLIVGTLQGEIDPLVELARHLEDELAVLGFPRERRPFWPHLTIARARIPQRLSAAERDRWATQIARRAMPGPSFRVDAIQLIESRLLPGGPVYTTVATFPLRG